MSVYAQTLLVCAEWEPDLVPNPLLFLRHMLAGVMKVPNNTGDGLWADSGKASWSRQNMDRIPAVKMKRRELGQ